MTRALELVQGSYQVRHRHDPATPRRRHAPGGCARPGRLRPRARGRLCADGRRARALPRLGARRLLAPHHGHHLHRRGLRQRLRPRRRRRDLRIPRQPGGRVPQRRPGPPGGRLRRARLARGQRRRRGRRGAAAAQRAARLCRLFARPGRGVAKAEEGRERARRRILQLCRPRRRLRRHVARGRLLVLLRAGQRQLCRHLEDPGRASALCPAGTAGDACAPCPPGEFAPEVGAAACTPCPTGWTPTPGAASCAPPCFRIGFSDVYAPVEENAAVNHTGLYASNGGACAACPAGSIVGADSASCVGAENGALCVAAGGEPGAASPRCAAAPDPAAA
jgi:hypothetical protein